MRRLRTAADSDRAGEALRQLINLVSHRSGAVFALMNEASVTTPQVVLLSRVEQFGPASLSDLAEGSRASAPAMSQMIERLVQQGWLRRTEDIADRRRKVIEVTPQAVALLNRMKAARAADYAFGLSSVEPTLRAQLTMLLERVVEDLEEVAGRVAAARKER